MPGIISGSSGGSLMCAIIGTTKKEDLVRVGSGQQKIENIDIDFSAFQRRPKTVSFLRKIIRLFTKGSLIDMDNLAEFLRANVGEDSFKEAYDRTGWVINIVVAGDHHEEYRVLNYMTAPNVLIWSAAIASCSIPLLFKPTKILCKDKFGKSREWLPASSLC